MRILVCVFLLLTACSLISYGDVVKISTDRFTFRADTEKNEMTVEDGATQRVWTASFNQCAADGEINDWQHITNPKFRDFRLKSVERIDPAKARLVVADSGSDEIYTLDVSMNENGIAIDVSTPDNETALVCLGMPPLFSTDLKDGYLIFSDRSSGVLKAQRDTEDYSDWILVTYGNTTCLNMPWVGVFDREKGDGLMVLFETPYDSAMLLRNKNGAIWPQPLWRGTLGKFGYKRRVSYHFTTSGDYVSLADAYRRYQQEQGRFKSLSEKIKERPKLERLAGSAFVWGDNDVVEFLKQARDLGVTRATFGNAERGDRTRADMEALDRLGYLTLRYDSYSDILDGGTWFQQDNVEKTAYRLKPDGEPLKGWRTLDGLQYYSRSSAFALNAAKTYSGKLVEDQGLNAHFIDVMCAMDLMEDYHPEHTFSRSKDVEFKREVLKFYDSKGLVLGTEHGNDWAIDLVDYTEGSLSGAQWWTAGENQSGWNPGHLQRPKSRKDFDPLYLKYGVDPRNRVPLWQLVYNDSVASTWYWGDSPGWFYEVAPEITDQKDITTVLYGALPLFWRDDYRGYNWSKNKRRWLESYYIAAHFSREVFGQRMKSHAFLTDDRLVQMTEFENGTKVVANFRDTPYEVKVDGRTLTLPKNGFYATAPGIEEGRIQVDSQVVTFVKARELFYWKSSAASPSGELSMAGELALYKLSDDQWNIVIYPDSKEGTINPRKIQEYLGWDGLKIRPLTADQSGGYRSGDVLDVESPLGGGLYSINRAER